VQHGGRVLGCDERPCIAIDVLGKPVCRSGACLRGMSVLLVTYMLAAQIEEVSASGRRNAGPDLAAVRSGLCLPRQKGLHCRHGELQCTHKLTLQLSAAF
jgi:hypothetical protein